MIDTDKHERILKHYKFRKKELKIYFDRSEEHPLGAYKFRQKDWQVRRFIGDARQARWTLSDMKEIYDEAMEEVKRLRELYDLVKQLVGAWDKTYHGKEACDMAETLSSWMDENDVWR